MPNDSTVSDKETENPKAPTRKRGHGVSCRIAVRDGSDPKGGGQVRIRALHRVLRCPHGSQIHN